MLEVGGAQPSLVFPNSTNQDQYVLTNGVAHHWLPFLVF